MRVSFLVPIHHLVDILVVLFETGKLFLHKHTSAVVEMVTGQVFNILHAIPTSHPVDFTLVAIPEVETSDNNKAQ